VVGPPMSEFDPGLGQRSEQGRVQKFLFAPKWLKFSRATKFYLREVTKGTYQNRLVPSSSATL